MITKQFAEIVDQRIEKIRKILGVKATEYESATDRLHNFKMAAVCSGGIETPEQALWGMARKHLVSIIDIVARTASGSFPVPAHRDEKIGDLINYLILLEALLIERDGKIVAGDA